MPQRLQRKRTRGWRKPEGSVIVDRTSRYGNPYRITGALNAETAVAWFRSYALDRLKREPEWLEPLQGKDLICFCSPSSPCHADVLLELASAESVIQPKPK